MGRADRVIEPSGGIVTAYRAAKHRVFQRMYEGQMAHRGMMGVG